MSCFHGILTMSISVGVLDDMNFTTTAGEVGTAHNNVNWTWTKDASNPPTLGLVWFVLRNADTSVLASPTGFAGRELRGVWHCCCSPSIGTDCAPATGRGRGRGRLCAQVY